MNKSELYNHFLDKITDIEEKFYSSEYASEEAIFERMDSFSDENGKLNMTSMAAYLTSERNDYVAIILSNLLVDLVENGYLSLPDNIDEQTL